MSNLLINSAIIALAALFLHIVYDTWPAGTNVGWFHPRGFIVVVILIVVRHVYLR